MRAKWTVIPEAGDLERYIRLAERYDAAFEYNDFFMPAVYEDEAECERRIELYRAAGRDTGRDTLHGVFYDIAFLSMDSVIRQRSRALAEQSLDIAERLGCKGVVFHTGRLAGLETEKYNNSWLEGTAGYLHELAPKYSGMQIYMENTFEKDPGPLRQLMERVTDLPNVGVCLDYAHALLGKTDGRVWFEELSPYIRHMHINDHDLKADLHLPVGEGRIDYGRFKELTGEYGIDVQLLHEVNGYEETLRSLRYTEVL